jgi:hypothetical protein
MEILRKNFKAKTEEERDNSDKKELLGKSRHPQSAKKYREEWSFIEYIPARENISYNMQYLEYMVNLYNDYQMYLTIESLHCKNMLVTITSIIECALYDLLYQLGESNMEINLKEREDFLNLIDLSFRYGILDGNMKNLLHRLRKVRNFVHISSLEYQEYTAYTIEQVNEYLIFLDNFQKRIGKKYPKMMKLGGYNL